MYDIKNQTTIFGFLYLKAFSSESLICKKNEFRVFGVRIRIRGRSKGRVG